MNKQKVAVGPGASSLILIAVVLTLCVLTVLTMVSARSDESMTVRSMETRQEVYRLFADGERSLAKLDAALAACRAEKPENMEAYLALAADRLPEGMKMEEDLVSWTEKAENRSLQCTVRVLGLESEKRTEWTAHLLTAGIAWEDEGFEDFGDFGGEEEEFTEETETVAGEEEIP